MSEWEFAFGLTGQALDDALSSGATYEEWGWLARHEAGQGECDLDDTPSLVEKIASTLDGFVDSIAVFIDAENVGWNYANLINEALKTSIRWRKIRFYTRKKELSTAKWLKEGVAAGFEPVFVDGKAEHNKVDTRIMADMLDFSKNNKLYQAVCIVSKDGDFSFCLKKCHALGKVTIVLSPDECSRRLKFACDLSVSLDNGEITHDAEGEFLGADYDGK